MAIDAACVAMSVAEHAAAAVLKEKTAHALRCLYGELPAAPQVTTCSDPAEVALDHAHHVINSRR